MTTTTEQQVIDQTALAELEVDFRGQLVRPVDASYDERRKIWNGAIDRRPALIARCAGVADVIAAVRFGRQAGLEVAVRSGGHSWPGLSVCDHGLVIDLSLMKGIRVDPDARTVRAEAGVLLGEVDRETQAFGLVVPAGVVTHTGLAGLTLGGGIGHTMRKFGLTIDSLLSVDLVTADGQFVKASETENPELFWGVRGGGGNFGIVTSFEFRAHPLGPTVLAGPVFWYMRDAYEMLRFYRDWIADVPDELTTVVNFQKGPHPSYPAGAFLRFEQLSPQRRAMARPRKMPTTKPAAPAAIVAHVPACAATCVAVIPAMAADWVASARPLS